MSNDFTPDEGFDPRDLPGAEVISDDGDVRVVAVPLSALPEGVSPGALLHGLAGAGREGLNFGEIMSALIGLDTIETNMRQRSWALSEVAKAEERHHAAPEDGRFREALPFLQEAELYFMEPETIYRAHCAELLDRVAAGQPLEPATDAEVFGALFDQVPRVDFCTGMTALLFRLAQTVVPEWFEDFQTTPQAVDMAQVQADGGKHTDEHEKQLRDLLAHDRSPEMIGKLEWK